ncbi:MAG: class I SAM-dependent methyltransferase [Bdellovibrionales bacterium]|nr:class I SAM-dependent methyltransferase [Bdellovibrionales bacterium]
MDSEGVKIVEQEGRLGLQIFDSSLKKYMNPYFVDFSKTFEMFSRDRSLLSQPLLKAIGVKKGVRSVIDATAGFCGDSICFLSAGLKVTSIERNFTLFEMISRERSLFLEKKPYRNLMENFNLRFGDAIDIFGEVEAPEVIYLDPMFPRKKKGKSPKEMQILQELLKENTFDVEEESSRILEASLSVATKRVVVKRPLKATFLMKKPNKSFLGKSIRYDLYLA